MVSFRNGISKKLVFFAFFYRILEKGAALSIYYLTGSGKSHRGEML
jgi:hypothetical protein